MYWLYWEWVHKGVTGGTLLGPLGSLQEVNQAIDRLTPEAKKTSKIIRGEEIPIAEDAKCEKPK